MPHYHAAVWLDHKEAKVFRFNRESFEKEVVHPAEPVKHLHHKAMVRGAGNAPEDQHYYHAIVEALADAHEVLVLGPSTAKLELVRHAHRHDPAFEKRIVGIETVDHPTDRQVVAYARQYFEKADRLRPQRG